MGVCYRCMRSIKSEENGFCDECLSRMSSMKSFNDLFTQGWICPKCGAVMSPRQACCLKCSPILEKATITCYENEDLSNPF